MTNCRILISSFRTGRHTVVFTDVINSENYENAQKWVKEQINSYIQKRYKKTYEIESKDDYEIVLQKGRRYGVHFVIKKD